MFVFTALLEFTFVNYLWRKRPHSEELQDFSHTQEIKTVSFIPVTFDVPTRVMHSLRITLVRLRLVSMRMKEGLLVMRIGAFMSET